MATHDYDIANQSGAAFRIDLNNALAAIQSNNSNASSPATTVAYQWWADTNAGVMKLRNSSNNAWIEIFQLDGTLTLEDGSVSAPALSFRDDLNTGVYSSAADTFNVATGGVERMELGATTIFNEDGADVDFRIEGDNNANLFYADAGNDRVGIKTSSPAVELDVNGVTSTGLGGLDNSNIYAGLANNTSHGGVVLGAGTNGNSPFVAASKLSNGNALALRLITNGTVRAFIRNDQAGIAFGTDTAAANVLDDYEEGTWTALLNGGNFTATQNGLRYTKIGRMVTISGELTGFSSSTNGTAISMTGAPFSCTATASYVGTILLSKVTDFSGFGQIIVKIDSSSSTMTFTVSGRGSNTDFALRYQDFDATDAILRFTLSYFTD
tara:strand:+ start:2166 stop:3311 length:1146 start_codon:yes stop_codon:yes gene_type:complete